MAKRQRMYKIDVSQVEKDLAILDTTKQQEQAVNIRAFCLQYAIPVDEERVASEAQTIANIIALLPKEAKK